MAPLIGGRPVGDQQFFYACKLIKFYIVKNLPEIMLFLWTLVRILRFVVCCKSEYSKAMNCASCM